MSDDSHEYDDDVLAFIEDERARISALHLTCPKQIWLQIDPEAEQFDGWEAQTWCSDQINDTDVRYVLAASRDAEVESMRQQLAEAQAEPTIDHKEYKTWWELALHVGAWKDHDFDYVHFGSEAAVRAYAILLLRQRDEYEQKQFNTIESLRQQLAKWVAANCPDGWIGELRQQLGAALSENQQLRTNARRVFEQEEFKHDQAIAAVIFGKGGTK